MVRILSHLVPCLALTVATLAAKVELSRLESSDIAVRDLKETVQATREAILDIHVEFETHASLIVGLGDRGNFGIDLELGGEHKKPHLGLGFKAQGPVGLSVDICIRALLANLQLTLDGNVACTGPSNLSTSVSSQTVIACSCTDPNISLDLHLPKEKLDLKTTVDIFALQNFNFVFTKDNATYPITVSKPAKTCDDKKKCTMEYHNTVACK